MSEIPLWWNSRPGKRNVFSPGRFDLSNLFSPPVSFVRQRHSRTIFFLALLIIHSGTDVPKLIGLLPFSRSFREATNKPPKCFRISDFSVNFLITNGSLLSS